MGPTDDASEENHESEVEDQVEMAVNEILNLPTAFQEKRHVEEIASADVVTQTWRMKERMKTVSVALVLCLNVGVDPPDVVKTSPCARKECWLDPLSQSPQKALESIGGNLQKQYERWQPRARYKQSLDPTVDDVKRLCTSLRRNAKDERVLFHYNGHGVPRPTSNGEVWVFNKAYTQYIPLSIYDLQSWMGSPSIFVYDCSCAGLIVSSFESFIEQREQDMQMNPPHSPSSTTCDAKNCIQLAACSDKQLLPMNPDLPADLFTACLTTPIKVALQWFCHQRQGSLAPGITLDLIEKIPGRLNDRRTPLGELNWMFTAITDTIAWNTLPRELFQKLFRQDLLVASLFRNFLLAERVMRSYRCTPVSSPRLPATFRHPMWTAWDHALDACLSQLSRLLSNDPPTYVFQNSPFFEQHLTAFQVWLSFGVEHRDPPVQLPIVLQVLLSQVHRLRALELLGRFLDLGPWAVSLALSVGIFPYVLKLLQSQAKELRPLLVFIWAKILAVDSSCQSDLVKDQGHQYFLRALQDPQMPLANRTMAAFILAEIVKGNPAGQEACLQRNIVSICLNQLDDEVVIATPKLRQWVAICLGRVWTNYDDARWRGVRDQAHERLYDLLHDCQPENGKCVERPQKSVINIQMESIYYQVRAAAVYALGTFVDNHPESVSDHAAHVNQAVGARLALLQKLEASVLVRCELASALQRLVSCYDSSFAAIAYRFVEEDGNLETLQQSCGKNRLSSTSGSQRSQRSSVDYINPPANYVAMMKQAGGDNFNQSLSDASAAHSFLESSLSFRRLNRLRKISLSSLPSIVGASYSSVNANIWKVLLALATDPHPDVATLAKSVVSGIMERVVLMAKEQSSRYVSESESPRLRSRDSESDSIAASPKNGGSLIPIQLTPYTRTRKAFWKGPDKSKEPFRASEVQSTAISLVQERSASTQFCSWSAATFAKPTFKVKPSDEEIDETQAKRQIRLDKVLQMKKDSTEACDKLDTSRLSDQQFFNKSTSQPVSIIFHPHNNNMLVADRSGISVWEWETGHRRHNFSNNNPTKTCISCMELINLNSDPLLLVGSDDGCIRIWKNPCKDFSGEEKLVSAWQAINEPVASSRTSGIVMSWDQTCLKLFTGGDSRQVQIWNTQVERKEQEFSTGADSCVTCLDFKDGLLVAGCGDGSVRIFDARERHIDSSKLKPHRPHDSWLIETKFVESTTLLTASEEGDVKLWDIRGTASDPVGVLRSQRNGGLHQLDVHPSLHIIACSSSEHAISFLDMDGSDLASVRYYDGFLGQRIGLTTCLKFHPLTASLGVGTADCFVTVYSSQQKNQ